MIFELLMTRIFNLIEFNRIQTYKIKLVYGKKVNSKKSKNL